MANCQKVSGRDLKSESVAANYRDSHVHNTPWNRGNPRSYSHETEACVRAKSHSHSHTLARAHEHSGAHTQSCLAFICSIRRSFSSSWWGAAITVNHRPSEGIHLNDSAGWKQVHCCQGSETAIKSPGSIKESITAPLSPVVQLSYLRNRFGQAKQMNKDAVFHTRCFPQSGPICFLHCTRVISHKDHTAGWSGGM